MYLLIDKEEFDKSNAKSLIPLKCKKCGNTFHRVKRFLKAALKESDPHTYDFCSRSCSQRDKKVCHCSQCKIEMLRIASKIKRNINNFCSYKCKQKYDSENQTGFRSKLERWLEKRLTILFPDIAIEYNNREILEGLELDIYIPDLKLAFELNGPFHYEPIYGIEHLTEQQRRDKRKILTCNQLGIEMCVIDTSIQRYFKEKSSEKFLRIITKIINDKMEEGTGVQPDTN